MNTDGANTNAVIEPSAFFKISYGLYVLTAREQNKDNGCIINTAVQLTSKNHKISITVNKENYTHGMLCRTKEFNLSVLTNNTPFELIRQFGFSGGANTDKLANEKEIFRADNGIVYIKDYSNALISGKITDSVDCGTHTLFIADVTCARQLGDDQSLTYDYYYKNIKPKPQQSPKKKGFVCKICGYVYEGDVLPADFICPICKHGADDFEPLP